MWVVRDLRHHLDKPHSFSFIKDYKFSTSPGLLPLKKEGEPGEEGSTEVFGLTVLQISSHNKRSKSSHMF